MCVCVRVGTGVLGFVWCGLANGVQLHRGLHPVSEEACGVGEQTGGRIGVCSPAIAVQAANP